MPIFEYQCTACGLAFEKLVFVNSTVSCPNCTSDNVVKKFSTFGLGGGDKQASSGCSGCASGSCSSCK